MKLKLRRRRRAGDEGAGSALKRLLVIVFLLAAAVTLMTYTHARTLVMYGARDVEVTPRSKMSLGSKVWVMLTGQTQPKPRGIVDPSKYELPFQQVGIGGASSRILSAEEKRQLERRKRSLRRKDKKKQTHERVYVLESWFVPDLEPRGLAVLFHDYGQSKADLIDVAAEFHDLHFSVLLVDLRASGETEGHETTFGFYEARDVAQAVLKANDFTPAGGIKVVYGVGTGAAAILKAAADKSLQADALILEGVFDELRHFIDRRIERTGLSAALFGYLVTLWVGSSENFKPADHKPVAYARKVQIPTLVLQGGQDPDGSKAEADRVAAALKTKAVVIPKAGRPIPTTQPEAWFDTVQPFLAKIPRPSEEVDGEEIEVPEATGLESRASH